MQVSFHGSLRLWSVHLCLHCSPCCCKLPPLVSRQKQAVQTDWQQQVTAAKRTRSFTGQLEQLWGWRSNPGSCSKAPLFINQLILASFSVQICYFFKYGWEDSVVLYLCKMYFSVQSDRHTVFEFSSKYQLLVLTRIMLHSRSIVIAFSYGKHLTLPKQDSTSCWELKQDKPDVHTAQVIFNWDELIVLVLAFLFRCSYQRW